MFTKFALAGFALFATALASTPSRAVAVDLELQLLVDVLGSVSASEFNLQRDGYIQAFRDSGIISAIENGTIGSIAVQLIYWSSGSGGQAIGVDWTEIFDSASSNAFADAVMAAGRPFSGGTEPSAAINFGAPLFNDNGFEGSRLVMDVSGDGTGNAANTQAARDAALAGGVDAINGLAIGGQGIEDWYLANIVGGAGGFVIGAATFEDFAAAIQTKLGREIIGTEVPVPGAFLLMLTGIAFLGRRKLRRA